MNINSKRFQKIVIIGNSGSGKSYLARQLAELLDAKMIHLDEHFWEPGGFNKKRPADIVHKEIEMLSQEDKWIMEGVFGDLASTALQNATTLIFLDKSWEECEAGLLRRGPESSKQLDPIAAENSFKELLGWAKAYWERENSRSRKGHEKLFLEFRGEKISLINRKDSDNFLKTFTKPIET